MLAGHTDQCHEPGSHADEGAGGQDDQGELPASDEAHAEAAHEGGEPLDEDAHLVGDGVVDLVDVAVTEEGGATRGIKGRSIRVLEFDSISFLVVYHQGNRGGWREKPL